MVTDPVILSHFARHDPIIFPLFETLTLEKLTIRKPSEYFVSLCREIIGQQLSGRVADVIFDRFTCIFPRKKVTAFTLTTVSDNDLRATGMSWSKVRFIRNLAEKIISKELDLLHISTLSDIGIVTELTKVKGIGPWTAEMFLIFTLGRPDVFSYGDLGLRRAIQKLYTFKKEPTIKQMKKIVDGWKPYRTHAARLLWGYLDLT